MSKKVVSKQSRIHGRGVFATQDLKKGELIVEYKGKKITKKQADHKLEKTPSTAAVYIFDLNSRYDIDGNVPLNKARYINHSCKPNCESQNIDNKIWIVATRAIKKGEELCYDYHFTRGGWDERPCYCGAKGCFGFIVSKRFQSAIKKTQKYLRLRKARQR